MLKKSLLFAAVALSASMLLSSCSHQTSTYALYVPEEQGLTLEKITDESVDYIVHPSINYDYEYGRLKSWAQHHVVDVSRDGKSIAYVASKNNNHNIFVRSTENRGSIMQRTHCDLVNSFCYSPNGENICYSEFTEGRRNQLSIINAKQGNVTKKISPSNTSDFAPRYSVDGKRIFFERWDGNNSTIWSYDLASSAVFSHGYGACPTPINNDEILCTRINSEGFSEIWRVNFTKGTESLVVSQRNRSFTTPSLSPDGKWILCVSSNKNQLDVYVVHSDGGDPIQLTFDPGNDYSPVWSPDGKYIYYLSQRGTRHGQYNIWKIDFRSQENSIQDYHDNTGYKNNQNNNDNKSNKSSLPKKVGN